jgi:hypothetical protein
MLVQIGPQVGNYSGAPSVRWLELVVHNVFAPVAAKRLFSAIDIVRSNWDASTLTTTVEVGAVDVSKGASVQLLWAESPLSDLLCGERIGWPRLHQRVMEIKKDIDWEASAHPPAEPSMILNRLANTAVRMQAAPHTAADELGRYSGKLAAAVALHTAAGEGNKTGLPSHGLRAMLKAWLA